MLERLEGLDEVEQTACLIAERALGAVATAYDVAGRQGAVEALLDYPDGRRGAFEVTQLATDRGASLQLASLLKQDRFRLPLPGKWWWTIKIGHPRDRPRLRSIFAKTALLCESVGVTDRDTCLWPRSTRTFGGWLKSRPCRWRAIRTSRHRWTSHPTSDGDPTFCVGRRGRDV